MIGNIEHYPDKQVSVIEDIDDIGDSGVPGVFFYHVDPASVKTEASYEYVTTGIRWALAGQTRALVTAPITKEKWLDAGVPYKGHTELLAKTAGVSEFSMFFWSQNLKVALYTIHIPLIEVFQHIRKQDIVSFIRFVSDELKRLFSREFIFLVSGLNPHSGESGYLGQEELEHITPAVEILQKEINIHGPFPPDIIFLKAKDIEDAVVISWYHDQGLIPFKLLNMHRGVNLTLGLPYIRTSPDHGTATDIAGKGVANACSMREAIKLAELLMTREKPPV